MTKSENEKLVSILLEPNPKSSDDDVVNWLKQAGAPDVERLAPGFISATLPAALLDQAKAIARVSVKTRKQLRRG